MTPHGVRAALWAATPMRAHRNIGVAAYFAGRCADRPVARRQRRALPELLPSMRRGGIAAVS
ncbi:creatininase domain protein, partial [Mycobacterium kansasii]